MFSKLYLCTINCVFSLHFILNPIFFTYINCSFLMFSLLQISGRTRSCFYKMLDMFRV